MKLINDYSEFSVYETASGKGVIFIKNSKRGNNAALFATSTQADATALALAFGGSVSLTHRIKQPVATNLVSAEAN